MPTLTRLLIALTWFAMSAPAFAADLNSHIKGIISDTDGLPVPNAELTLTSPDMQGDRTTKTDAQGRYRFSPLPPGTYTLFVKHPGFQKFESAPMKVAIATTVQVDVPLLAKGQAAEEFTVTGASVTVDTERVNTGVVFDAAFLKDIPTGRDYQSAVGMAPGVVGGGNPNMHGGFATSNQYYIDGVNTTDPMTNTFSMNMNFDAIDSVQVITGGMDAEYGRALGGAVNIVTKSGGNEFEGQAILIHSKGPGMVLAPEVREYGDRFDESIDQQLVLNLGGPIIKDKVWFFSSFQGDRSIRTFSFDNDVIGRDLDKYPLQPRNWRSLYWFGKITAQPTPEHRIWVNAQGDPTWIDNVEQSAWVLPSAETVQNQGGWLGSIGHQWTPNERVILETQVYHQASRIEYSPMLWKHCQAFDADGACGHGFVGMEYQGQPVTETWQGYGARDFTSGEPPYAYFTTRFRSSVNSSLTLFGDLLGEHQVKVGIQAERLASREVFPGISENGFPYFGYDAGLDPEGIGPMNLDAYAPQLLHKYDNDWKVDFVGSLVSWYVQDVYKPHRRLTLRPGIRFDRAAMLNENAPDGSGRDVVFNSLTAAPRFGVAYDLTNDNKTSLHAYYGRFYDTGFLILSALLQRTSQAAAGYSWNEQLGDWNETPQYTTASKFLKHRDLRNPYSDQFNIGLTREIAPGTAIDVTLVYNESRRFWEDDEVNLIWNHEGDDVIGYRNGRNEAVYRLRTPDDLFTQYTSIETSLRKSFGDHWGLMGSYVWSRSWGTNSSDQATANADIPEQRPYEVGYLAYDMTHVIKLMGSYTQPEVAKIGRMKTGYTLGWNFFAASGTPYRPITFNNYYGGFANYDGPNLGRYRLPAQSQTDLRAGMYFNYDDRVRWMLGADIFNVFNDRTITRVATQYDPTATVADSPFGAVLDRQRPRRMQVVIRGEF